MASVWNIFGDGPLQRTEDDPTDAIRKALGVDSASRSDHWEAYALCAQTDPEIFFPEKGGSTRRAKEICASCEVREQCLQAALNDKSNLYGVWGGLSERERRQLKRNL